MSKQQPERAGDSSYTAPVTGSQGALIGPGTQNNHFYAGGGAGLPPPAEVRVPRPRLVALPRPANPVFIGRNSELAAVTAGLAGAAVEPESEVGAGRSVSVGVIGQSVQGLGGIGKTELVLQFCHSRAADYGLVWWITADSARALDEGLEELTRRLCRQPTAVAEPGVLVTWAVDWLSSHTPWLLILDNVENPRHIEGLLGELSGASGHILVTTRRTTGWGKLGLPVLGLDLLSRKDAAELLLAASQDARPEAVSEAAELAAELDRLPLALEQAGAYARQTETGLADYRDLLRQTPEDALAWTSLEDLDLDDLDAPLDDGDGSDITDGVGARSVARVWATTMRRIRSGNPLAGRLLDVLAWLAPDDIPRSMLITGERQRSKVDQALGLLASYSMITLAPETVNVHRLVQTVARSSVWTNGTAGEGRDEALRLMSAMPVNVANDTEVGSWPQWRQLAPHAEAWISRCRPEGVPAEAIGLARKLGIYRRNSGSPTPAVRVHEWALKAVLTTPATATRNVVLVREALAESYRAVERFSDGIRQLEMAVAAASEQFGANDEMTLDCQNNLGLTLSDANRNTEAVAILEATLAGCERLHGATHQETLITKSNLALAYEQDGQFGRALGLYEAVLQERKDALGDDHPDTLTSMHNLAGAYDSARRFAESRELYERLIEGRARILGPSHEDTLHSSLEFAALHLSLGEPREAIALYQEVLARCEQTLEADHPRTLYARHWLSEAQLAAGLQSDAAATAGNALAASVQKLGPFSATADKFRSTLSRVYASQEQWEEAIALWREALETATSTEPSDLARLDRYQNELARLLERGERWDELISLWRDAFEAASATEPPDPDRLDGYRTGWGRALRALNRWDELVGIWRDALNDARLTEPVDQERIERCRDGLAEELRRAGRRDEQSFLWQEALVEASTSGCLAAQHIDRYRSRLSWAYQWESRWDDQIVLWREALDAAKTTEPPDLELVDRYRDELANALGRAAQWEDQIALRREALDAATAREPREPERVDERRDALATSFGQAERWDEQIDLQRLIYEDRLARRGADDPETEESGQTLVNSLFTAGRLTEAIDLARQLLATEETSSKLRNVLGCSLAFQDRVAEAAAELARATADNRSDAVAWNNLGRMLDFLGRREEAMAAYREAVDVNPRYTGAWTLLSWALVAAGRRDEAERVLLEHVEPNYSTRAASIRAILRLADSDRAGAVKAFAAAVTAETTPGWTVGRIVAWALTDRETGSQLPGADEVEQSLLLTRGKSLRYTPLFGRAEAAAVALCAAGAPDQGRDRLQAALAQRLPGERLCWPHYQTLLELGIDVSGVLGVWRGIIADDPEAAGPWSPPAGI